MIKRIVITGGPSSGKTSIIDKLQSLGHKCLQEVSREIIKERKIETSFKDMDFEEIVFNKRIQQFFEADSPIQFYDRSILDGLAYLKINKLSTPTHFLDQVEAHKYHSKVFIAPPWEDIYKQDSERLEEFEDAKKVYHSLKEVYTNAGYELIDLPIASIDERIEFILDEI